MRAGLVVAALLLALAGCVPPPGATSVTYAYNEPAPAYYRPRPAYYYAPPPRYYAPYYPPRQVIVAPPPGRPYWDRPGYGPRPDYGPRPGRWDDDHRGPQRGEPRPGRPNDGRPQNGGPQRGGPGGFGPRP